MSEQRQEAQRALFKPVFTDAEMWANGGWDWVKKTYAQWLATRLSDDELTWLEQALTPESDLSQFSGLHTPAINAYVVRALKELRRFREAP